MTTPTERGWYPTEDGAWFRYHDGTQWTDHVTPATAAPPPAAPRSPRSYRSIWAICTAVIALMYFASRPGTGQAGNRAEDSAYVAGWFVGMTLGSIAIGALIAWPIWWFANRNRTS